MVLTNSKKYNLSLTWKAILNHAPILAYHTKWSLGNSNTIRFWSDTWLGDRGLLIQYISNTFATINVDDTIAKFITDDHWIGLSFTMFYSWRFLTNS